MKVLQDIIKTEKQMKEKFKALSEKASTPEMRALFQELSREEERHERELSEKLTALRLMRE